ncbi:unnamed protein product [Blepharisma stoltei]|uniref:Uncharacterized protein n=1 Tax=Blepharisma stoltei TaxID=1481888 RepID=A0AAU9IKZ3_9CILI|nr:unnamed protein product [Blepharisma stoltei]
MDPWQLKLLCLSNPPQSITVAPPSPHFPSSDNPPSSLRVPEYLIEQTIISEKIQESQYNKIGGYKPLEFLETIDIAAPKAKKTQPKPSNPLPVQKFIIDNSEYEKSYDELQRLNSELAQQKENAEYKKKLDLLEKTLNRIENVSIRLNEISDKKTQERLSELAFENEKSDIKDILKKMNKETDKDEESRIGELLAKNKAIYSEVDTYLDSRKSKVVNRPSCIQVNPMRVAKIRRVSQVKVVKYPPISRFKSTNF